MTKKRLMLTTAFVLLTLLMKAQTVVSGKVTDTDGQPLAHVSVMVEGTEIHTVTNDDGMFTLKTPQQPRQLLLSHIGYKSRKMVVTDVKQRGDSVKRPRGRSSFGLKERFYDRVEYFDDPDFWADYNIIEPTESLENAIGKLKKKIKETN